MHKPDVLIVNPALPGYFTLRHLKEESGCAEMKCIALLYSVSDSMLLRSYDGQINIYDSPDEIKGKLERLNAEVLPDDEPEGDDEQRVVCVVKGMTNREIADRLFLSTHTVITHRRNIARKLQIHSASGLTIYAIVNKLVELGDIKRE